jgi:hypothetical protein
MRMKPRMTRNAEHYDSKVPEVTLGFCIIIATTLGGPVATPSPWTWDLAYLTGTAFFPSALLALVVIQIATKKFHPFLFWSTIVASTRTEQPWQKLVQAKVEKRAPEIEISGSKEAPAIINIMAALKESVQAKGRAARYRPRTDGHGGA